jgi:hypothetical protein
VPIGRGSTKVSDVFENFHAKAVVEAAGVEDAARSDKRHRFFELRAGVEGGTTGQP